MITTSCREFGERCDIAAAAEACCGLVAPFWPLDRSIAVNPYWGFRDCSFERTMEELARLAGSPMTMPPSYYKERLAAGEISEACLAEALAEGGSGYSMEELMGFLDTAPPPLQAIPLLSDRWDARRELTHAYSWGEHMLTQISQCCASYFDGFQAEWPIEEGPGLYRYWLQMLEEDRGSEFLMREDGLRERCRTLPREPLGLLEEAATRLHLSPDQVPVLFAVAMLRVPGWASYGSYLAWQAKLAGRADPGHTLSLLAIRVAWELLLDDAARSSGSVWAEWQILWQRTTNAKQPEALKMAAIWLRAEELSYQQRLVQTLSQPPLRQSPDPAVQAVFCIDVRSEPMRRAIESTDASFETLGFAGFFGVPMEYRALGSEIPLPHLPGLFKPDLTAVQTTGDPALDGRLAHRRVRGRRLAGEYSRMPASSFSMVEILGMGRAVSLWKSAFASGRRKKSDALRAGDDPVTAVQLDATLEEKASLAERFLRATGLDRRAAPLVVLVGHAGQTVNNPTAAGLNCGACCGQSGLNNARVMRDLLNDPEVMAELRQRGVRLAREVRWAAALHNTTTETVQLDPEDLARLSLDRRQSLQRTLAAAAERTLLERKAQEGGYDKPSEPTTASFEALKRASNWAETRPEWGLANNAAFVAGPRWRTRGLNLEGRCFLHEYDPDADKDGALLEQIMTGPVIVAHWINMQYFASTVDPLRFGAGDKTLHNVVGGALGLFEGNSGDLRTGLALQSVHDGRRWRHAPLRLTVVVFAPRGRVARVIARSETVRELLDGRWLELICVTGSGMERIGSATEFAGSEDTEVLDEAAWALQEP